MQVLHRMAELDRLRRAISDYRVRGGRLERVLDVSPEATSQAYFSAETAYHHEPLTGVPYGHDTLFDGLVALDALDSTLDWRSAIRDLAAQVRPAGLVLLVTNLDTNLTVLQIEPVLRSAAVFGEYVVQNDRLVVTGRRLGGLECLDAIQAPYTLAGENLAREVHVTARGELVVGRGATYDLAARDALVTLARRGLACLPA